MCFDLKTRDQTNNNIFSFAFKEKLKSIYTLTRGREGGTKMGYLSLCHSKTNYNLLTIDYMMV